MRGNYMTKKDSVKKLTDKQELILNFIKEKIKVSGFPPTVREICDKFKITVKGAYDHVKAIEKKGYIRTEQNKSRAILVLPSEHDIPTDSINIQRLCGIAARAPIRAGADFK